MYTNQYSEINVIHFSFNLLRIKGLYMFRALLAYPQEALHKRHLVYCVLCQLAATRIGVELVSPTQVPLQPSNHPIQYNLGLYVLYLRLFSEYIHKQYL
jgi:hypothetical protein